LDLRLSYLDSGLAIRRPHRAGQRFAKRTALLTAKGIDGWCGRRGRGRQRLVAEGCDDRRDDDQQAGDTDPADPNPTGRSSCWFAVGHAAIQGSVVLPARIGFSICRRYAPAGSIESMRVLIVEDEPFMAEAIRDGLRLEAIAADIAGDGDTALELLTSNAYDIAVLDRDIPGPSGDEVATRIVATGSGMPILMLTAADRLDDKATGFELGADDYLTKPFELRELVLRLRALDRRRTHHRPPVREIAGLRLDPFRREVYRDGRFVALTRKQFAVLEVLVDAEGGVVSAEELLARAWDENADPFTNAVRITVSGLRKRLGEPWIIATAAGVGYRLTTQSDTGPEGGDDG
jgi:two-component system, OmpR family, response regulator VanR